VGAGVLVSLTASASSDADGTITTHAWSQTAGPAVALSDPAAVGPTFTAPPVANSSVLTFRLTVTDNLGATSTDSVGITVTPPPGTVPVSGRITFSRIPFKTALGSGLDYAAMRQDPARGITVEIVNVATGQVIASGSTDADGDYALPAPASTMVSVRAWAEMIRPAPLPPPNWAFAVGSPDVPDLLYSYALADIDSGPTGILHNLDIPSGWSTDGSLIGTRHAAPFAILDTLYRIQSMVLDVAPTGNFPPLIVDWSVNNPAGETFYARTETLSVIVLPGMANVDTEEYDVHVIGHEFGHYIVDRFSRSDSIGGPHTFGDRLDPRLAFNEGFASAFAAITLGDPVLRDSFGPGQANDGHFNVENNNVPGPGWYGEGSVWAMVWDLFDSAPDANDTLALGFPALWQVMTGPMRDTDALGTVFPFIAALKQQNPGQTAQINSIVNGQSIDANTLDIYGSTETHSASSPDVLPIYTDIAVDGPARVVRSVSTFGTQNKLSNYRFLKLELAAARQVRIQVTAAAGRDPDIRIYRRGVRVSPDQGPADEDFTLDLEAGTYILAVYDCGNANCNPGVPPGIVDITVRVTSN
jgi:hypothetical protein